MEEHGFVVIDFETANPNRASACAVGLAKVLEGQVVATYSSLIKPLVQPDYFTFTDVHGITAEMVEHAPSWNQVWNEILGFAEGLPLVAHNATFDYTVIHRSLMASSKAITPIPNPFYCSVKLAKHLEPALEGHGLAHLASLFSVELDHHDALSDATATAHIAIKLLSHHGTTFARAAQAKPIILHSQGLERVPGGKPQAKVWTPTGPLVNPDPLTFTSIHHINPGARITFTGEPPPGVDKEGLASACLGQGYVVGGVVNEATNLLVAGPWYSDSLRGKNASLKFSKALALQGPQTNLSIISYENLLELLR